MNIIKFNAPVEINPSILITLTQRGVRIEYFKQGKKFYLTALDNGRDECPSVGEKFLQEPRRRAYERP